MARQASVRGPLEIVRHVPSVSGAGNHARDARVRDDVLEKNCAQLSQSKSAAQAGSGLRATLANKLPTANAG